MIGYKNVVHFTEQHRPKWGIVHSFKRYDGTELCVAKMSNSTFLSGSRDSAITLWDINLEKDSNVCRIFENSSVLYHLVKMSNSTFASGHIEQKKIDFFAFNIHTINLMSIQFRHTYIKPSEINEYFGIVEDDYEWYH